MASAASDPNSRPGVERLIRLIWYAGIAVWCPMVLFLLWRLPNAQSYAEASLLSTRLGFIAGFGCLWSVAGAIWQAKVKKAQIV